MSYLHQLDDPYSLLVAQVLPRLLREVDVELEVTLMPPPSPAFRPEPARLRSWAARDAAGLARRHGLRFPAALEFPDEAALALARAHARVLDGPASAQLEGLVELSHALLAGEALAPSPAARGATLREQALHYQGAMLNYEGEWYWGLDRLPLLEQRLRAEGLSISPSLDPEAASVPDSAGALWGAPPAAADAPLELFYSMRSPYSYLVLERAVVLARRYGATLELRLVLPMVARGLPVPPAKRMYIVRDAKRVASELGIPFGRIADPIAVIERAYAVAHHAHACGHLLEWVRSVGAGVWAEGVDIGDDAGLRMLAARAGLDPDAAMGSLGDTSWRAPAEANREALLDMGLWGVPCLRLGELSVWGQDRLDVIEAALRARASAA